MVKNLRFILGGLAFATPVALGEIDASVVTGTNNAPPVAETKVPEIASFNTIYTNNILHVEIRGKSNNANLKKYFLQSTTNLASNIGIPIANTFPTPTDAIVSIGFSTGDIAKPFINPLVSRPAISRLFP